MSKSLEQIKTLDKLIETLDIDTLSKDKRKSINNLKKLMKIENKKELTNMIMFYALGCMGKDECSDYSFAIINEILQSYDLRKKNKMLNQ